jgi:FAD/FMN-containing dehydrogenase
MSLDHFRPIGEFTMSRHRRQFLWSTLGLGSLMLMPGSIRAQATSRRSAVDALALDGSVKSLSSGAFTDFAAALRGNVLSPGDDGYDSARRIFFHDRFDRRPAFIVQATGPADVALAVAFARENNLLMSIKGGGHSDLATSGHDQAMMLDLGLLRGVRVDPRSRRAWVAGATPAGLIDHESAPHLLATPLGGEPTVGFGGLALGGGFGKLGRTYGLTLDSVRSIDVVCADGQLRRASADENADLFWALRGGGSNFGVATAFEIDLHPVPERVFAGALSFPFRQLRQVVRAYGDFSGRAPDDLYVELYIDVRDSADASLLQLNVCYIGRDSDAALRPLRQFGDVLRDDIRPVSFATAQHAEAHQAARAPEEGAPRDTFFRSGLLEGLAAPLASVIAESLNPEPGRRVTMLFLHAGGAISRRPPASTAFSHRSASHDMIFVGRWSKGEARHGEHIAQIWAHLLPFTRGFYVNEMAGGVNPSEVADNYGANAFRLAEIKRRWDPDNLFRLNANILPAG